MSKRQRKVVHFCWHHPYHQITAKTMPICIFLCCHKYYSTFKFSNTTAMTSPFLLRFMTLSCCNQCYPIVWPGCFWHGFPLQVIGCHIVVSCVLTLFLSLPPLCMLNDCKKIKYTQSKQNFCMHTQEFVKMTPVCIVLLLPTTPDR